MFPVDRYRHDTPGCGQLIHFNNAGCSLHPQVVVDTICQYLQEEARVGGYELAALRASALDGFYQAAAELLHTHSRNIAFVASATDGFSKALSAIPWQQGDVILTTLNDYVSSQIQFASLHKRFGVQVVRAANTASGEVDIASMEACIRQYHPKAICLTHVPNNTGMVQPIEAIGDLCAAHNIWYLVDACQSAGQIPLDVQRIKCDFLSFSMRKFMRGPRGAGVLFVSDKALQAGLEPLFIDMRGADWTSADAYTQMPDAKRFEYVEQSYAIVLGSAIAMRYYIDADPVEIEAYNTMLCSYARQALSQFEHIKLLDRGTKISSIISLHSERTDAVTFRNRLHANGINAGAAAKKFALLDFEQKGVEGAVRISPHYYNTISEIDQLIDVIRREGI